MKSPISFVYFDVGGVALFDFSANDGWNLLLSRMGITSDLKNDFLQIWDRYKERVCIDFDVDELLPVLTRDMGLHFAENFSLLTAFVDGFAVNESIHPVMKRVLEEKRLGLLTNMYPRMMSHILLQKKLPEIPYEVIVDSSVVRCQKPNERIFILAQELARVPENNILFVDNSMENLQTAERLGWQTFLYDPSKPLASNKALERYIFA